MLGLRVRAGDNGASARRRRDAQPPPRAPWPVRPRIAALRDAVQQCLLDL